MSRQSHTRRLSVIFVGIFGFRALLALQVVVPGLMLITLPLILGYLGFVVLTWVGGPIFTLLVRLDRFGRLALSPQQIEASNWLGACLLAGALGTVVVGLGAGLWPGVATVVLALLDLLGAILFVTVPSTTPGGVAIGIGLLGALFSTWLATALGLARARR